MNYHTNKTQKLNRRREAGSVLLENMVLTSIVIGLVSVTIQLARSLDTHFTSAADILLEGELCDATLEPARCDSSWDKYNPETSERVRGRGASKSRGELPGGRGI